MLKCCSVVRQLAALDGERQAEPFAAFTGLILFEQILIYLTLLQAPCQGGESLRA